MTDYLLLVSEDETALASPQAIADAIEQRARYADALRQRGQLRDHGRFRPSREGKRVWRDRVEAGPFADDGKALAAYYWITAASLEHAAAVAAEYPALAAEQLDVRPLMKGDVVADKDRKPGKIFGFAVLGNADNEAGWTAVMDRIDAETRESFPADSFAGGNRLQAPRAGKRVVSRATFDGPFLESKEIIGGVFFLRMMAIEDAVRWAAASRFVAHGALEIRELWRT